MNPLLHYFTEKSSLFHKFPRPLLQLFSETHMKFATIYSNDQEAVSMTFLTAVLSSGIPQHELFQLVSGFAPPLLTFGIQFFLLIGSLT